MKRLILLGLATLSLGLGAAETAPEPAAAKVVYEKNFEKEALDSVPSDFLVMDGAFAVKEEAGNKFLELPGAPVDSFGIVFGPTDKENTAVSARIFATGKGRRFPAFSVGLGGVGGYKLQVSPAKKLIELYRGDSVKASVPYEWAAGQWVRLRLEVKAANGSWKVEGKVWPDGAAAPATAQIALEDKEQPTSGRASIWGNPFSGTPLRFDDLAVSKL